MPSHRVSMPLLLAAGALFAGLPSPGRAATFAEDQARYEIRRPAFDRRLTDSEASARIDAELSRRYDGQWSVVAWDPQTRTPAWIVGSGFEVSAPFLCVRDVESVARRLLAENADVLRADAGDLRLAATPHAGGKWAAHFQQTYAGLDVWGGKVRFTFTDSGRLFVMGSTFYPGIALDTTPTLTAEEAALIARNDLPFDPATDSIEAERELLILPVPSSASDVDFHLVWRVKVHMQDPLGIWVTHVDGHDGSIVWRYNAICFADFTGDARGAIEPNTWCNGIEEQLLKYMRVTVTDVGTTYTDVAGNWSIPYGGSEPREVVADLIGPYVRVSNMDGPNGRYTAIITPGMPYTINFEEPWAQQDELDCFDAVNDLHDFFMQFAPDCPTINQQMRCFVSEEGACIAYFDGAIHFLRASSVCQNTGRLQSLVDHEFGHAVTNDILGWDGDQGVGEGNGDFLANLMTQESWTARGWVFSTCEYGGTNSDNDLIYPDDVIDKEFHQAGQVIAGFHWDFMIGVQAVVGEEAGTVLAAALWHNGRVLELPDNQPDQVIATFIADDDDGNLTNGTPHYELLAAGAEHHHFPYPILRIIQIAHDPLWTRTEEGDAPVVASIYSLEGEMDPDSVAVNYSVNGGEMLRVAMTATGNENEWRAILPDLRFGDSVGYYLRAVDVFGNSAMHPYNAPHYMHTFNVSNVYDPFEAESGWCVNLEGTDTAPRGIWVRTDPNGTVAQPENDHTPDPGANCWVTGNGPPGYPAGAYDVDHGITSLYSAIYDLTGAESALASFWRWYSNDQDANPREDYWGVWVRNNGGPWQVVEYTNENEHVWARRDADLLSLFGEQLGQVRFKFAAADTGGLSLVEACVDDFEILARMGSAAPDPDVLDTARFSFAGSRGMPVVGPTTVEFEVPAATRVRITVFDVGGRTVRRLTDESYDAGRHSIEWDARDGAGRPLASGIYYCRMRCPGFTATRTVVLYR